MIVWIVTGALLLLLLCLVVVRYGAKAVRSQLRKHGLAVEVAGWSLREVTGVKITCTKGKLKQLSCRRISWAAGGQGSTEGSEQQPWLPLQVQGLHIRLAAVPTTEAAAKPKHSKSSNSSSGSKKGKASKRLISQVVRAAGYALPHLQVDLEDSTVELEDAPLGASCQQLHLRFKQQGSATAVSLLLQQLRLQPGGREGGGCMSCPAVQVMLHVAPGDRRAAFPMAFPSASLQVGLLEVTSLPHLLLALAAVPKAPKPAAADSSNRDRQAQLEGPAKQKLPPALVLQKLLPALPEKAKVSFAGVQVRPAAQDATSASAATSVGSEPALQVSGTVGAVTLSCAKGHHHSSSAAAAPAAAAAAPGGGAPVEQGAKLMHVVVALGPVQLEAWALPQRQGPGSSSSSNHGLPSAAVAAAVSLQVPKVACIAHLTQLPTRQPALQAAAPGGVEPAALRYQVTAGVDVHAPMFCACPQQLEHLAAAAMQLSAQLKALRARGRMQQQEQPDPHLWEHKLGLPSPASSIGSLPSTSSTPAAALGPGGYRGASPVQPASTDSTSRASSSSIDVAVVPFSSSPSLDKLASQLDGPSGSSSPAPAEPAPGAADIAAAAAGAGTADAAAAPPAVGVQQAQRAAAVRPATLLSWQVTASVLQEVAVQLVDVQGVPQQCCMLEGVAGSLTGHTSSSSCSSNGSGKPVGTGPAAAGSVSGATPSLSAEAQDALAANVTVQSIAVKVASPAEGAPNQQAARPAAMCTVLRVGTVGLSVAPCPAGKAASVAPVATAAAAGAAAGLLLGCQVAEVAVVLEQVAFAGCMALATSWAWLSKLKRPKATASAGSSTTTTMSGSLDSGSGSTKPRGPALALAERLLAGTHAAPAQQHQDSAKRKPGKPKVVQVSLQVQAVTVQFTAPAPCVDGFREPAAEGSTPGPVTAGKDGGQSCLRLEAAAAQVLVDMPSKLTVVSVQQLQVEAGVRPPAAGSRGQPPQQQQQQCGKMYSVLQLHGLQLRHLKQPAVLMRIAAKEVASRVHIDAILAGLSVAVDALTVAAAAQQRQLAASSPLLGAGQVSLPQVQVASPPVPRPPSGAGAAALVSSRAKQKPRPVIEWDFQSVDVSADVCDHDQVGLKLSSCSGSTLLNQAVVNGLQLTMNGAELLAVEHLCVQHLLKGVGVAAAAEDAEDTPFAGSSPSSSPEGMVRAAPTAAGAAGNTAVCGLEAPGPWQQLKSREPSQQQDPALYERQMRRQLEGRARCELPLPVGAKQPSAGAGPTSTPTGQPFAAAAAPAAGTGAAGAAAPVILSLQVFAEGLTFTIPFSESPGRLILVCETWAKAVKQVVNPYTQQLKAAAAQLKASKQTLHEGPASAAKASSSPHKASSGRKQKFTHLELVATVHGAVLQLAHHPMESWMALHGPVLRSVAAQQHLVEQVLGTVTNQAVRRSSTGTVTVADPAARGGAGAGGGAAAADAAGAGKQKSRRSVRGLKGWGSRPASRAALDKQAAAAAAAAAAEASAQAAAAAAASAAAAAASAAAPASQKAVPAPPSVASMDDAASTTADGMLDSVDEGASEFAAAGDSGSDVLASGTHALDADTDSSSSSSDSDVGELAPATPSLLGMPGMYPGDASSPAAAAPLPAAPYPLAASSAAAAGGGEADVQQEQCAAALEEAYRELLQMYRARCTVISATTAVPQHHRAALMHVAAASAETVVIICLPGFDPSFDWALGHIQRVDPPSEGVGMDRIQTISIDAGITDLAAHFSGVKEMAAGIKHLGASGLLLRARQIAAEPQFKPMRMRVGAWHAADVPMVVKGTRPPMKMYTDLKAEIEDLQGGFCPGMEAAFGQLNQAFKRLTTPNQLAADGSVPPSTTVPLPWWDMMRYMWRGTAAVRLRNLAVVLANSAQPHVTAQDQRIVLHASTFSVGMVAGRIDITSTDMSTVAFARGPDAGPGDALLVLPAFHLPLVTLGFVITPKMPAGRSPLFHHAFPILNARPLPGQKQGFVDVFKQQKCEGWGLSIDIGVQSDKTNPLGTAVKGAAEAAAAAAAQGGGLARSAVPAMKRFYNPPTIPHAFIGEFQIKYIIDLVDTLVNCGAVVRLCRKLRMFYSPPRTSPSATKAGVVPMPLLKQRVDITLTADTYRISHDAQDAADPSDLVYLDLSSVRYANSFTYTPYQRQVMCSTGPRWKPSMRQHMGALSVEAYALHIVKPPPGSAAGMWGSQEVGEAPGAPLTPSGVPGAGPGGGGGGAGGGGKGAPAPGSRKAGQLLQEEINRVNKVLEKTNKSSGGHPAASPPHHGASAGGTHAGRFASVPGGSSSPRAKGHSRSTSGPQSAGVEFGQGLMAAAACFLLKQARPEAGTLAEQQAEPRRPIKMIVQDVKLYAPADLRDTCALLFVHMQQAFGGISFQQQGMSRSRTNMAAKARAAAQEAAAAQQARTAARMSSLGARAGSERRLSRHRRSGSEGSSTGGGVIAEDRSRRASLDELTPVMRQVSRLGSMHRRASSSGATLSSEDFSEAALGGLTVGLGVPAADAAVDGAEGAAGAGVDAGGAVTQVLAGDVEALPAMPPLLVPARPQPLTITGKVNTPELEKRLLQIILEQRAREAAAGGELAVPGGRQALAGDGTPDTPLSCATTGTGDVTGDEGGGGTSGRMLLQSISGRLGPDIQLEYEIEFVHVQVNLVSDNAAGSLVLGTNSATLMGHLAPARRERTVTFKMDQVQAHVVDAEVDPASGTSWLDITAGNLAIPAGGESFMKQVLEPFKCLLVVTKPASTSSAPGGASLSGGGGTWPAAATATLRPGSIRAQQELSIEVPEIGARLDSRQFEILVDVVQNTFMAPLPQMPTSVRSMWRDPDGVTEVDDDMDVASTLDLLQACREGLRSLQHQALLVYTAGAELAYSYHAVAQQLLAALGPGALAAGGLGLLRLAQQQPAVRFLSGPIGLGVGRVSPGAANGVLVGQVDGSERLQEKSLAAATAALSAQLAAAAAARARLDAQGEGSAYFGPSDALSAPAGGSLLPAGMQLPGWARGVLDVNQLGDLLRPGRLSQTHAVLQQWVSQQAQGALESLEANRRGVLTLLREEAMSTRVGQRHSMSLLLRVDMVNWALANGPQTFVQGELQGILYETVRDQDHTGTTKIVLHTMTFTDPVAAAAAATGGAAGAPPNKSPMKGSGSAGALAAAAAAAAAGGGTGGVSRTPSGVPGSTVHGEDDPRSSSSSISIAAAAAAGRQGSLSSSLALSPGLRRGPHGSAPDLASGSVPLPSGAAGGGGGGDRSTHLGTILSPWDPDGSWGSDDMVRITCIHGPLEPEYVVYDYLEVELHPIRVRLTVSLATALQEYFQLKQDDDTKERQQEFSRSMKSVATSSGDKRRTGGDGAAPSGTSAQSHGSLSSQLSMAPGGSSATGRRTGGGGIFSRRLSTHALPVPAGGGGSVSAASAGASFTAAGPSGGGAGGGGGGGVVPPTISVPVNPLESEGILRGPSWAPPVSPSSMLSLAMGPDGSWHEDPCITPSSTPSSSMPTAPWLAAAGSHGSPASSTTGAPTPPPGASAAAAGAGGGAAGLGGAHGGPSAAGTSRLRWAGTLQQQQTDRAAHQAAQEQVVLVRWGLLQATRRGQVDRVVAAVAQTPTGNNARGRARQIKFKHVRFNRMHAMLTWKGPMPITDFVLVLDGRLYKNVEGGWRDVFTKYQWDIVKSVVKSTIGLNRGKLKPIFGPSAAEDLDQMVLQSSLGGVRAVKRLVKGVFGKQGAEAAAAAFAAGGEGGEEEEGRDAADGGGSSSSKAGGNGIGGHVGRAGSSMVARFGGTEVRELLKEALRQKVKHEKLQKVLGHVPGVKRKGPTLNLNMPSGVGMMAPSSSSAVGSAPNSSSATEAPLSASPGRGALSSGLAALGLQAGSRAKPGGVGGLGGVSVMAGSSPAGVGARSSSGDGSRGIGSIAEGPGGGSSSSSHHEAAAGGALPGGAGVAGGGAVSAAGKAAHGDGGVAPGSSADGGFP